MMKLRHKKLIIFVSAVLVSIFLAVIFFPLDRQMLYKSPSQVIYAKDGELLRAFLSPDEKWRMPVKLDEVSKYLKTAVITVEDQFFYCHPGVNPWSIIRAGYLNIKHKKIVSGGSTITMQVARMVEHRERNILSKLIEIIRALKLELFHSKDEILELYFNMAPYGGNIEGVGAACYYYFQKGPAEISLAQAALLTAIPNSPIQFDPTRFPERIKKKRDNILRRLWERKLITEDEYLTALKEQITIESTGVPFRAPHFTDLMQRLFPNRVRVYTTLDWNLQTKCQAILQKHLKKWRDIGITNAALVVIDNETHSISALIGSYDFFDELHSGQVNGALAPRSPGSTLKPILYAIGLDQGLITPASILYDVPVSHGGYTPENYDGKYQGVVTVREALTRSLNVPAVELLAKIGVGNFISFLQQGGITTIKPKERDYGLSIILGGCEVNLVELTTLYSAIANAGVYRPLRYCQDEYLHEGKRILSDGAAYIISELLAEVVRPDLPIYWEFSRDRPKVAWKTGTSFRRRDAWSIGYTKRFTAGIWVGNFDGQGVPELSGARVAGPILFDVLNTVAANEKSNWFTKPASVSTRKVCTTSGMVPNDNCRNTVEELYLRGKSSIAKCSIHRAFYIDSITGCRLCKADLSDRVYKEQVFEIWPSEVATWMERNGYPLDTVPPLLPESQKIMAGEGPVIRAPDPDCEYCIREGVPLEFQKILLNVSVANSVSKIFCFLDGKLIWSGSPSDKIFILPEKGEHNIVCQDDHGRSTSMKFVVR